MMPVKTQSHDSFRLLSKNKIAVCISQQSAGALLYMASFNGW